MDHLPIPHQLVKPEIKVPLRCKPSYGVDFGPDRPTFASYPESQGWDTERLLIGDVGSDPDATEAFLQQWLFFGLLYEIVNSCGTVLHDFEEFVYTDERGLQHVTTAALPSAIERWREAKGALPSDRQLMVVSEVDDILADARYYISKLTYLAPSTDIDLPLDDAILLSVIILGETLEFSKANIFKDLTGGQGAPIGLWGNRHTLGHLLREQGCCLGHVRMLEETVTAGTMYYAYRSGLMRDHKDHADCTEEECMAYQIDPQIYSTAHITPDCHCVHVHAPVGKIRTILARGGYPVISLSKTDDFELDVIEAAGNTVYTAFSHVWSDGLGNPQVNSLPRCQLEFLRDRAIDRRKDADQDSKLINFWIDTVCVPLDEPFRGNAIELIKTTFANATEVVVLDARLQKLSALVPYTESMMRVTFSGWLRRLWTFLEGVLAQKLFFQFADGAVEIRVWQFDRYQDKSTDLWNLVAVDASQFYWLLRRLDRYDPAQRVARLWNALQWRSTSRISDETICVASLFGLDLSEILNTSHEQRMRKLLEMQQWYPPGIIFMNGERLQDEGFGWAPKSFLARQSTELALLNDDRPAVRFNGLGLPVVYPGLLISVPRKPLTEVFLLLDKDSEAAYLVMRQDQPSAARSWETFGPHALGHPAIITSQDMSQAPESVGLLVDVVREEGGCMYVRCASRLVVRRESDGSYAQHVEGTESEQGLDVDEYLYATARPLSAEQRWCIT